MVFMLPFLAISSFAKKIVYIYVSYFHIYIKIEISLILDGSIFAFAFEVAKEIKPKELRFIS